MMWFSFVCETILYAPYRNKTLGSYVSKCWQNATLSIGKVPVWLWISWRNGTITIGMGNVTGRNLILYYPENFLIANVSTVAVSSYVNATGDWRIPYNQNEGKMHFDILLSNG